MLFILFLRGCLLLVVRCSVVWGLINERRPEPLGDMLSVSCDKLRLL